MIEIEIDGQTHEAEPGSMIIEVADKAGVHIPRFCYHKKLSVAANCRMCLVDVEKAPKALPACATPVAPGMVVKTQSKRALDAQKAVMEFLLINHPLDCPICDQGGQCELQDVAMGYGQTDSSYTQRKRSVEDEDIGPLVYTEMTRCIHCTRCVRFGEEIAGVREIGLTQRGESAKISTYIKHSLQSEISANIIDLCPVGALTAKPSRFEARAWEVERHAAISPHDCLGSNMYFQTRRHQVMAATPRDNESINQTWLADRDRFSHMAIHSDKRLQKPMIKEGGQWREVEWQVALNYTADALSKIKAAHGAEQIGFLAATHSTVEEGYLLAKLARAMGSNNIDYRLQQTDFTDQKTSSFAPKLGLSSVADIADADRLLLIGSNIRQEQPLAGLRVREAAQNGAEVSCVNMQAYDTHFDVKHDCVVAPQDFVQQLAGIAQALAQNNRDAVPDAAKKLLTTVSPYAIHQDIAKSLTSGKQALIILGPSAWNHPSSSVVRQLSHLIADLSGARIGALMSGANSNGLSMVGVLPHRTIGGEPVEDAGLPSAAMLADARKAYVLLHTEPHKDAANPAQAKAALAAADFVVAFTPFRDDALMKDATVLLPIGTHAETAGTFVNATGVWQTFQGVIKPVGEARPAWKVLRVLANVLSLEGFEFESAGDVLADVNNQLNEKSGPPFNYTWPAQLPVMTTGKLMRIGEWPIYQGDAQVRRADALQQSQWHHPTGLRVHPETAAELQLTQAQSVNVKQAGETMALTVIFDERVPKGCAAVAATAGLGELYGELELV
ncbi:MAG: NADH-quinone oxidoreductase [marine bacterium B5-7]|nr:MAG: NADH-quinone oxidoreductase [marine bacterium B5-7]